MRRRHVSRQGAADPPAGIGLAYRNRTTYSRATDYHVRGRAGLQSAGRAYSVLAQRQQVGGCLRPGHNASTGCITAILTGISVLSVTQLAGTPFAVVMLPPPTVTSLVGPAAPVAVRTAATATIGFADDSGADAGPYTVAVWDKASGQVVYDTQSGAANGADPVTALTGGAVQIHRR